MIAARILTWSAQNCQKATMKAQVEMQLEQFKAELEAPSETMIEQIQQRFEARKVDREHEHNVELEHIQAAMRTGTPMPTGCPVNARPRANGC